MMSREKTHHWGYIENQSTTYLFELNWTVILNIEYTTEFFSQNNYNNISQTNIQSSDHCQIVITTYQRHPCQLCKKSLPFCVLDVLDTEKSCFLKQLFLFNAYLAWKQISYSDWNVIQYWSCYIIYFMFIWSIANVKGVA